MRKQHPNPIVQVNPATAGKCQIQNGAWVWLETKRGRVRQKCKFEANIDPRVIHAEHGWWFPELPGEEPWLHGGWPLKTALCKIYKAREYGI